MSRRVPRLIAQSCALGLALALPSAARAQRVHVIAAAGLSGEPAFRLLFEAAVSTLVDSARARWHVADSSLFALAEDTNGTRMRATGRATRKELEQSFLALSRRVAPGDIVLVFLVGHGSGEGTDSRVSLPGPDATAADFAGWLAGLARQNVVFVNAASGSGDFGAALAGPRRVIVTATRTALERNETRFATPFVRALTTDEADADKDGRVSVLEAFAYAKKEVARVYEADHRLLTEHATISDSTLARSVTFGAPRSAPTDPRAAALVAERSELESQVAALRGKKESMTPAAYDAELERLLVLVAQKTQAIRALGSGAKP
ncbi:MAG: hypothetical protein DMD35_03850 [Gemmatimonadetes bacterium]|nr:MAG: hypothetical protein DMD35_03850 [Gemmatimonadota bacterium]